MRVFLFLLGAAALGGAALHCTAASNHTFTVDYGECNCFRKDGVPFRYVSGSMHYFKIPHELWQDRMERMKAAGITVLQTYIAWNVHEPFKGVYNFDDMYDLFGYLDLAVANKFDVLLRVGPYIDAERDAGGLPFWLKHFNATAVLRSSDPSYMVHVRDWFDYLLPRLRPYMYVINGTGPVLNVQLENEYGFITSYGEQAVCDKKYLAELLTIGRRHLGPDVLFVSTDGGQVLEAVECGANEGVFTTVDFGAEYDPVPIFRDNLRKVLPRGPAVNAEFHIGGVQGWGGNVTKFSAEVVEEKLLAHLEYENSTCVNVYMFHGGTNFGFGAGGGYDDSYHINGIVSSYDFDAPVSENGDITRKYVKIRNIMKKYFNASVPDTLPANFTRISYGVVVLHKTADIFQNTSQYFTKIPPIVTLPSVNPLTYEEILLDYGFALYEKKLTERDVAGSKVGFLESKGTHDRGIVFVDKIRKGTLSRTDGTYNLTLGYLQAGQTLSVLVENQGRICFGPVTDRKGLAVDEPITLDGQPVTGWTVTAMPLNDTFANAIAPNNSSAKTMFYSAAEENSFVPARFDGQFFAPQGGPNPPFDTYLRFDTGWGKGVAFVNGYNLGRYWPLKGRVVTLFVPGVWLNSAPTPNHVVLVEVEQAPCNKNGECLLLTTTEPCLDFATC